MNLRVTLISLAIALAVGQSGCATVLGAVAGAALCGDSSDCERAMVETGAAVDVGVASVVADGIVQSERNRESQAARDAEEAEYTAGGEAPRTGSGDYYHCVDAQGHHVVELVAPSVVDATMVCVSELGYPWSDPRARELCSCRSPS